MEDKQKKAEDQAYKKIKNNQKIRRFYMFFFLFSFLYALLLAFAFAPTGFFLGSESFNASASFSSRTAFNMTFSC